MPDQPEPFSREAVSEYLHDIRRQVDFTLTHIESSEDINPRTSLEVAAMAFGSSAHEAGMPDVARWVTKGVEYAERREEGRRGNH